MCSYIDMVLHIKNNPKPNPNPNSNKKDRGMSIPYLLVVHVP